MEQYYLNWFAYIVLLHSGGVNKICEAYCTQSIPQTLEVWSIILKVSPIP